MPELVLDSSSIAIWQMMFYGIWSVAFITLVGLALVLGKSRVLAALAGIVFLSSLLAIWQIKFSPYAYYWNQIHPTMALGEEVMHHYTVYKEEHGQYPSSIKDVYFTELDTFDIIKDFRYNPAKCDGFGDGCTGLLVTPNIGSVNVEIYHGLIHCMMTSDTRNWACQDKR
ncbi:MAG: hypothetical protein AAF702_51755 [Chloroflexota bacterium]